MEIQDSSSSERRWTHGSYAAAGFAIFIFLYGLAFMIISTNLPTDGWIFVGDTFSNPPNA
jgi:hypothetical protein